MQVKIFVVIILALVLFSCNKKPGSVKKELSAPVKKESTRLFDILNVEKTGIDFENKLTESLAMNGFIYEYYYNGAGLAVADFNNDGLQDIYFNSNRYANKLYQNTGNLKFIDITSVSGASKVKGFATGVTAVDINADGLMDIYISTSGKFNDPNKLKNQLLVNKGVDKNGIPHFVEEGAKYNLDIKLCSTQAAFFDYDRDNDLDMFLINHYPEQYTFGQIPEFLNMKSNITGDRLYENRNGKYYDITEKAGVINSRLSYALGVGVGDLNNDGWPDIYVSNDYSGKDFLYMNNRNGTFTETVDESLNHMSFASMGNDIGDFNNDGWLDIFTLDMMAEDNYGIKTSLGEMKQERFQRHVELGLHQQYMFNTIQLNNGTFNEHQKPFFSDVAHLAGITSTDWSWAPLLFDMDNDGYKDVFIANGIKGDFVNNDFVEFIAKKQQEIIESGQMDKNEYLTSILNRIPRRMRNNYFYKNNGDLTFEKKNNLWAGEINTCSNGSAYADFDNDGDMDLIVNNSESKSFIYKNNARENNLGSYLQFQFEGPASNPLGIGTKVILKQKEQMQVQELYLSRGFQSSTSPVVHFGIGADESVPEVQIIWPDGKKEVISDLKPNQRVSVSYKNANDKYKFTYPDNPLFTDATSTLKLNYSHVENEFDDYKREYLLPHKMSGLGPALAVADVNNDGLDDFYVGGAKGYSGKLFIQESGGFKIKGNNPWEKDKKSEDINATFFDADNDGDPDLYVTSGSNENRNGSAPLQDRLYINTGSNNFRKAEGALPNTKFSGSCIKPCDFDNDGDLDLFVGGRQIPGKYPYPASSCILKNESVNGNIRFIDVTQEVAPQLKDIGMVTDATWTDISNDGKPDLVVVGEWMSVKILKNTRNRFEDITNHSGLANDIGWWNSILSDDFDGDGDMDLIAGNLGLNYKYKATKEKPFEVFARDFDNNGINDIVIGYYNEGDKLYPLRGRDCSSMQMPFIKKKFPTHDAYGRATLEDVYGADNLKKALNYKANNFATCYIENKGNEKFEISQLDNLAQISSVNGILSFDINKDGNPDVVIGGNLYDSEVETVRNDAGVGLLLAGDGNGGFNPVPANISGLKMQGDVKGISLIGLGNNGRKGIIVAKNNDKLQVIEINK